MKNKMLLGFTITIIMIVMLLILTGCDSVGNKNVTTEDIMGTYELVETNVDGKIVGEEEIRANNIESTLLVKENGKALIMAGNVITEYEYDNTNFYFYIDGEKNSVKWVYKNNMLSLIQDDNYKWTYRRK